MADTTTLQISTAKDAKSARSTTALTVIWNVDLDNLRKIALRKIIIDTQQAFRGKKFDRIPTALTVNASDFIPGAVRELTDEMKDALSQREKVKAVQLAFANGTIDKATHDTRVLAILSGADVSVEEAPEQVEI